MIAMLAIAAAMAQPKFEITSLLGKRLESQADDKGVVEAARKTLAADPSNISLIIKLSAAQASLSMNVEAEATCTQALEAHSGNRETEHRPGCILRVPNSHGAGRPSDSCCSKANGTSSSTNSRNAPSAKPRRAR